MLAGIGNYLFAWQLPLIAVFVTGWVFGGGYLLSRSVKRQGYQSKNALRKSMVATFLAGVAGAMSGGVIFMLFFSIGSATDTNLTVIGAIVAGLVMIFVCYLVIVTMFNLPVKKILTAGVVPIAAIIALAAVIAAAAGVPAYYIRQSEIKREFCREHLLYLDDAVRRYEQRFISLPQNLEELVEKGLLEPEKLRCPAAKDPEEKYFYLPSPSMGKDVTTSKIRACDLHGNHDGGRMAILVNGECLLYSNKTFQTLLDNPENAAFAKAFHAMLGK